MTSLRHLPRHCRRHLLSSPPHPTACRYAAPSISAAVSWSSSSSSGSGWFGGRRWMSTGRRRSMESKVEARMRLETYRNPHELRRALVVQRKLMSEEERLIFRIKKTRRKVAVLLRNLKKYQLPELPPNVHDPELLTPEHLQSLRKIGFKNKNYYELGARGVFGGTILNMHLHWKYHETVQVFCDHYPLHKIKEISVLLARLSGGIVVSIHNGRTIVIYRGRNYRQPKSMTPFNTLTKRKALFKARFEQAINSLRMNIMRMEQQLQRLGINPDQPVAMTSSRRIATTFFTGIDQRGGSPYAFQSESPVDSDQEELDSFVSEIENAAEQEFAAEEAAEKESFGKIRYWNKDRTRLVCSEAMRNESFDDRRHWRETQDQQRVVHGENFGRRKVEIPNNEVFDENRRWFQDTPSKQRGTANRKGNGGFYAQGRQGTTYGQDDGRRFQRSEMASHEEIEYRETGDDGHGSEDVPSDLDDEMWESGSEEDFKPRTASLEYGGGSDGSRRFHPTKRKGNDQTGSDSDHESDDVKYSDETVSAWESDDGEEPEAYRSAYFDYGGHDEEDNDCTGRNEDFREDGKAKTDRQADEDWDSD